MKAIAQIAVILLLFSCQPKANYDRTEIDEPIKEKFFLNLGGEEQYVEIISESSANPILVFIHGGPAWPQTPQLRHYSSELASKYTLVIWEQRGAGLSYGRNPDPNNLTLEQIVADGHELTSWLKMEYDQEKIFIAGYSWGSLIGVELAQQFPEDYHAYIGIAQIINMDKGIQISNKWLTEKAQAANDTQSLLRLDSLRNLSYYEDDLDRFFTQWLLLNEYGGAIYNQEIEKETEIAMSKYDDYKDYDWMKAWAHSSKQLQVGMFGAEVEKVVKLEIPVYLLQGRHDWNIPSALAEKWLNNLDAPKKQLIWFENSGHGLTEEEPQKFNEVMLEINSQVVS